MDSKVFPGFKLGVSPPWRGRGGFLFLFLIFSSTLFSQQQDIPEDKVKPDFKLIAKIPFQADFITTDNLGNLYLVKQNELLKYNSNGVLLQRYSNKTLGKITYVDATNPLKLLVFYRELSQVVFLDNMLAETVSPVRLQDLGYDQSQLAATSYNSSMWLYDQNNFQLLRLDQNLNENKRTGNIGTLLRTKIKPSYLLENDTWVYLNNSQAGIMVFDVYGTYFKTLPVLINDAFQVIDDQLFYTDSALLKSYHLKQLNESTMKLPEENVLQVQIQKERLYLLTREGVSLYSFN